MFLIRGRSLRATLTLATLTVGIVLGSAGIAQAADEDPRAAPQDGNVVTCEAAGIAGTVLTPGTDFTFTGGVVSDDQYVTITGVSAGVVVTGIVVKGGDAYNVYTPGLGGLPPLPPWQNLRSPLTNGGQIPQLSHWFVCGTKVPPSSSSSATTPPTSKTTTTSPETAKFGTTTTPSQSASSSSTSTSSAGGVVVATTTTTNAAVAKTSGLASTGFGNAWLVGIGAALVLGGAALMFLFRSRRKA